MRTLAITVTLAFQGAFAHAQSAPRMMEPKDIPTIRSAQDPQISPDGRSVAYVVSQHDAKENLYQTDIFLVSASGGEALQLTRHGKNDRAPQFSPDGSKLAFLSEREEKAQIFLTDLRGGEPWRLSDLKGGVSAFDWSPDGKWIAALSADAPSDEEEKRTKAKDDERGVSRPSLFGATYVYPMESWLAKGALILEPNYRGSAGYGEAFRSLNVRNLGVGDAWDVNSGIDSLVAKGLVDKTKVGASSECPAS